MTGVSDQFWASHAGSEIDLTASQWLDGLDASPAEVSALDQALAEAAGELEPDYSAMSLDEIIADAEAEAALQDPGALPAPGDTPWADLSHPSDRALAMELANVVAEAGDIETAAQVYGAIGSAGTGSAVDLANGAAFSDHGATFSDVIEMSNGILDRAATVAAEDTVPLPRRTEARLSHLLGRVSRNTYEPTALQFASPSAAARELARRRWQASQPGLVTGRENCGASDEFGYCLEPTHATGCGSLATTETATALRDSGSYARLAAHPLVDANNRAWTDQFGRPMSLTGHVEAATGQRLGGGAAFETGQPKREVTTPGRLAVFGDPDEPDGMAGRVPRETAALAGAAAAQMGIAAPSASRERERARERRDAVTTEHALRSGGRVHPDFAESARERRERLHRPVTLRQAGQPEAGALAQYEAV